jgi:cobalt-zinc-cadmium efflux system membrane fusion protein
MNYFLKIASITFLTLSVVLFQSCKQKEETTEPTTEEVDTVQEGTNRVELTDAQYKNANLELALPEKTNINQLVTLNGKSEVMPENVITVSSPMAGFVRQIKLMAGMAVTKGQVLIRLEEKEYIQLQQDYLSAKNTLAFAKLDYDRQTELVKNQAASDKILQTADEKVKQNQIIVRSLEEKLRLININPKNLTTENMTSQIVIFAPASGTVTEVMVNSGKYVHPGDDMIKIISNTGTKLVLKAFEKDLPFVNKGQKIIAYSNAQMDKKFMGKIEYIVRNVGDEGFANIICNLEGQTSQIIPGMYMNADIEVQNKEGWIVPDEAIINFESKEYVFVENGDQTFEMVEIEPGQKEKGKTQIINDQAINNRRIVIKGAYTLLMKMKNVEE